MGAKNDRQDKSILAIKAILEEYLDLRQDKDATTENTIREGVELKGATLWTLIFAILIASLGLYQNSTAVIIGAMLICPLLGPIMGIGLSFGLVDIELMRRSVKNYVITTLFSVGTSALFFFISPAAEGQSELLARTQPTIYDVLIALCGGMAGFIALATTKKGSVIPGVAIATALMPPLCTAGYGLATGNLVYFLGAVYLYFIDSVFIVFATYIGTRLLHLRRAQSVDKQTELRMRRYIVCAVVLSLIPAIYLTVDILKDAFYERSVNRFIAEQLTFDNAQVVDKKINRSGSEKEIRIVLVGQEVPDSIIMSAQRKMADYSLEDSKLVVLQGVSDHDDLDISAIRTKVLEDFYATSGEKIEQQTATIESLQRRLGQYNDYEALAQSLIPEMKVLYPTVSSFSLSRTVEMNVDSTRTDTVTYAVVKTGSKLTKDQQQKMTEWMKARIGHDDLRLIVEQ